MQRKMKNCLAGILAVCREAIFHFLQQIRPDRPSQQMDREISGLGSAYSIISAEDSTPHAGVRAPHRHVADQP